MDSKAVTPYFLDCVEPTVGQLISIAERCGLVLSSSMSDDLAAQHSLVGEAILADEAGEASTPNSILSEEIKETRSLNILDKGLGFAAANSGIVLITKKSSGAKRGDYWMSDSKKADLTVKFSDDTGVLVLFGTAVTFTMSQLAEMVKSVGLEFKPFNDDIANTRVTISTHPSTPYRSVSGSKYQLFAIEHSDKFTKDSLIEM